MSWASPASLSAREPATHRHREAGFALILVLWLLVLLSAIGIHLAATGRSETQIAANVLAAAQAEALADGGVDRAVFALTDPDISRRWLADGQARAVAGADGRVVIAVYDENAKINPNLAPDKLTAALFRQLGAGDELAAALAAAISARVRPGAAPVSTMGAGPALAAGAERPAPIPFDTLDGLAELAGMTPELLAAARPHLSVYAAMAVPRSDAPDAVVRAAIAEFQGSTPDTSVAGAPAKMTVTIVSTARTRRGGVFTREATIRLDSTAAKGYLALRWARSRTVIDLDAVPGGSGQGLNTSAASPDPPGALSAPRV
ncbi:MAG: general secretion pathway protein GspK [Alphaproteobacteria bacterium]|nr:general secretion pathway protein GspK [Alphaproteobacteria bacterium]